MKDREEFENLDADLAEQRRRLNKLVLARGRGGAVTRGFSPIPYSSSESSEECSDSTISSTASPVVLAKEIKKIVVKMDRKADKRDKKVMGMLKYIEQWVKYVELLVKGPTAVDGYAEK
jgi:hypothetical protein